MDDGSYVDTEKFGVFSRDQEQYDEDLNSGKYDKPVFTISIGDLSDLSLEEAIKLKEKWQGKREVCIRVYAGGFTGEFDSDCKGTYSIDKYIAILQKYRELVDGLDESMPEEKRFAIIYERVARSMYYDMPAAYPKSEEEKVYESASRYSSRNDEAFLNGKGVCVAFARVLGMACKLNGIECKYVSGPVDSVESTEKKKNPFKEIQVVKKIDNKRQIEREGHAWIKVKLNGVWYNVDPTWDRRALRGGTLPRYALLSDKTLKRTGRNTAGDEEPKCEVDAPVSMLRGMFRGIKRFDKRNLTYNKDLLEFETGEKIEDVNPGFFRRMFSGIRNVFKKPTPGLPDITTEIIDYEEESDAKPWDIPEDQKEIVQEGLRRVVEETEVYDFEDEETEHSKTDEDERES